MIDKDELDATMNDLAARGILGAGGDDDPVVTWCERNGIDADQFASFCNEIGQQLGPQAQELIEAMLASDNERIREGAVGVALAGGVMLGFTVGFEQAKKEGKATAPKW